MYNSPLLFDNYMAQTGAYLTECISCVCTEEVNTSFELVVEYPTSGELASQITIGKYIFCKPNPYDNEQYFHIYKISKTTQYVMTVYAEHISYAYNHFVCKPNTTYEDTNASAYTLMSYLNAQALENPAPSSGYRMTFDSSTSKLSRWSITNHTETRNVMSMASKLYDADWKFDNNYAVLTDSRGQDRNVTLSISTNLIALNSDLDISDMYTHIFPFWKGIDENGDTVTVYSNPQFIYIWSETRSRFKAYIYDCSNFFTTKPSSDDLYWMAVDFSYANWNVLGRSISGFNAEIVQRSKTIEGAYLTDADHVEIGDLIHITIPEIQMNTIEKVMSTKYDVLRDILISVGIGAKRPEITDVFARVKEKEEEEELEEETESEDDNVYDKFKDKIPDRVVKVNDNEVYAIYDNGNSKITWTASGSGKERYNFVMTVESQEEESNESGNSGTDNDVES